MAEALNRAGADLVEIDVEGTKGWARGGDVTRLVAIEPASGIRLLPNFDPFVNELPRKTEALLPVSRHDLVYRTAGWITPVVIVDGRVAGTWEISDGRTGGISVQPFYRWRGGARKELAAEVDRIAAFLDRPLRISVAGALRPAADP